MFPLKYKLLRVNGDLLVLWATSPYFVIARENTDVSTIGSLDLNVFDCKCNATSFAQFINSGSPHASEQSVVNNALGTTNRPEYTAELEILKSWSCPTK